MNDLTTHRQALPGAAEASARALARELATAYRDRVACYKHELGLSAEEATAKTEEPGSLSRIWKIQDCPPEQITWAALEELNRNSPERAMRRWRRSRRPPWRSCGADTGRPG